jgi:hypothetical protein
MTTTCSHVIPNAPTPPADTRRCLASARGLYNLADGSDRRSRCRHTHRHPQNFFRISARPELGWSRFRPEVVRHAPHRQLRACDHGSDSPYAMHFGVEQVGRLPLDSDAGKACEFALYARGPRHPFSCPARYSGRSARAAERRLKSGTRDVQAHEGAQRKICPVVCRRGRAGGSGVSPPAPPKPPAGWQVAKAGCKVPGWRSSGHGVPFGSDVARCARSPSDDQLDEGHRSAVQVMLAHYPAPGLLRRSCSSVGLGGSWSMPERSPGLQRVESHKGCEAGCPTVSKRASRPSPTSSASHPARCPWHHPASSASDRGPDLLPRQALSASALACSQFVRAQCLTFLWSARLLGN